MLFKFNKDLDLHQGVSIGGGIMKLSIIGVPTYYGCDNNGTQHSPQKLRNANVIDLIKDNGKIEVVDLGDIDVKEVLESDKFKNEKNIKYFESIYDLNLKLSKAVDKSMDSSDFTLILGGDHGIGLGSITGASKHSKNLGVVWIDAHGDFNTSATSPSKNYHGMPLACLCGHGDSRLVNLYYDGIKINEENVFHIGGRDIDKGEQDLLDNSKVNLYDKKVIDKIGLEDVVNDIIKKCRKQNIDGIHISLDIDFMDKFIVEGTGTRVEGGYTVEDTKYLLKRFIQTGIVKSMDFVEFNPRLDVNDNTLKICKDLLEYFGKLLSRKELVNC